MTLETVYSEQRGTDVELFTAFPAGYGDGEGLPVVVICHGATGDAGRLRTLRSAAVPDRSGRCRRRAVRAGRSVRQRAVVGTAAERRRPPGHGARRDAGAGSTNAASTRSRRALWGWSMGGYGVLRMAEVEPGWARAVAAFSPAISEGDAVFTDVDALAGTPLGLWCGTDDSFYDPVQRAGRGRCPRSRRSRRTARAVTRRRLLERPDARCVRLPGVSHLGSRQLIARAARNCALASR